MNKEDMKWLIQMMLIIAVPILVEYIKQKSSSNVTITGNDSDD